MLKLNSRMLELLLFPNKVLSIFPIISEIEPLRTTTPSPAIDTPEDVAKALRFV
jgi:hypothetical protein